MSTLSQFFFSGGGGTSTTNGFTSRQMWFEPGSYSFTVPTGVEQMKAVVIGAGGAGFHTNSSNVDIGGGGGGAYASKIYDVSGGDTVSITVGNGGDGGDGGASVVTINGVSVTADGGAQAGSGGGGAGGGATGGDINNSGGRGGGGNNGGGGSSGTPWGPGSDSFSGAGGSWSYYGSSVLVSGSKHFTSGTEYVVQMKERPWWDPMDIIPEPPVGGNTVPGPGAGGDVNAGIENGGFGGGGAGTNKVHGDGGVGGGGGIEFGNGGSGAVILYW